LALELLSRECNLQADGPDLGGVHRATWEVMRFQLDFAAQMLVHLFEGRDKVINRRVSPWRVIHPARVDRFFGSFFPTQWVGGGDILALCSAIPLLASRLLNTFKRHQNSTALLG